MNTSKHIPPSGNPADLDFAGHFDVADLRAELTPEPPSRGPVVSPDLLIGTNTLAQNHYFVNVARQRERRVIDPASITVLVMEDDNTTRSILEFMLTQDQGYKVRTASDVPSFQRGMQQRPLPDLLILDIELPGNVSGFNILAKVRSHPSISSMPVIIFTSHAEPAHLHRGLVLGADAYLSKPAKAGALAAAVKAVLGG